MVVIGPHGAGGPLALRRGPLTEHVLGTTADRVVRHAPCPVLVAARQGAPLERVHSGKWLVAIDFSPASRAALRCANELAKACEAELVPLHVVTSGVTSGVSNVQADDEDEGDPLRLGAAAKDPVAKERAAELALVVKRELGRELDVRVGLGRPSEAIARGATQLGANLVVMGTRGRTGLAHLLLGSVVERTLRRSEVPVLCVHTHG